MSDVQPWFAARILMESVHAETDPGPKTFEDKVVLLKAATQERARHKAKKLGLASEEEYVNAEGNLVHWVFRGVLDVVEVLDDELEEGTEVYYSYLNEEDVEALKRSLQPGRLG